MLRAGIVTTVENVDFSSHAWWRRSVSLLLAVFDLILMVLTMVNVHGPVRFALGLILGMVIPGWCIIGWMKLTEPFLEASMTVGVSLALIMLSAQLMLTVHWWHLAVFEVILCVVCLPILLGQAWRQRLLA